DGGALTPEQQQAQMDLESAENQPLCEPSGDASQEVTCDLTFNGVGTYTITSSCPEVTTQIIDSTSNQAISWNATVGEQEVASGVWDAVTEMEKVITFSYTPQSDSGSDEAMSTVTCTGTALGEIANMYFEDDCADGSLFGSNTADGMKWFLIKNGALIEDAGAILASGPLDLSTLTPDTPVSFEITYEGTGGSESTETTVEESGPCTATFTSTGVSWACTNGALFNVEIEDMSNQGVYPGVYCASEGTLNVAEGQRFWFNFFLVNGSQTFFDGWADEQKQNAPIEFTVPEDTEGVCTQQDEAQPEIKAISSPSVYGFTAKSDDNTSLNFFSPGECTAENDFAINWYLLENERYVYYSTSHAESITLADGIGEGEETFCGYTDNSYYGGQWVAEFVGNVELMAVTNVELTPVDPELFINTPPELPELPFTYSFDGPAMQYNFVLSEETRVAITVNSGQSCRQDETDDQENGFTDPEIWMYNGVAPWSDANNDEIAQDDNGYHSADNCSAAYVDEVLPAGSYFIWAENDDYSDGDTGTITVNSSVELTSYGVNFDDIKLTTKSVTVPDAMKIQIPAGGAHLVATLDSLDPTCEVQDSAIAVIDLGNGVTVVSDDDSGEDLLGMNKCSSFIDINLGEGEYLMVFSTYEVMFDGFQWEDYGSGSGSTFELKYGFVTESGSGEEIVVEDSNDPIPPVDVPQTAGLPIDQLKSDSGSSVGIADGVSTMVCTSTCVEDLFALEGITGDSLTVSIGSESVVVKKGASKVRVPVSSGARELVVTQKASDGSTQVVGSTKVVTSHVSLGSTSSSNTSESGSNMLIKLIVGLGVVVLAGGGVTLVRRRKAS
ncbi:MAG: hypothetical protein EBR53_02475, partial [Actinobacteria bacterium]|nr:hypothetical protein [Actinomycetota bacterium]